MMKPLLQEPNEPIMDSNYYECLDGVIDKSKVISNDDDDDYYYYYYYYYYNYYYYYYYYWLAIKY